MGQSAVIKVEITHWSDPHRTMVKYTSTSAFKDFVHQHVRQLLVSLDDDDVGAPLGTCWITAGVASIFSVTDSDGLMSGDTHYPALIAIQLMLSLIRARQVEEHADTALADENMRALEPLMTYAQEQFEASTFPYFMNEVRMRVDLQPQALLRYALKKYVRFARQEQYEQVDVVEVCLLMRLATERLSLRSALNISEQGGVAARLMKRLQETDYTKPLIIRGWSEPYVREIKDAHFRRFRN